ncbi:type 4a pilus biogenesis protein PilO [Arenimonas fontis]|uniref:Type 4a pilus biogenesis protein PilO n=1 Tax=Arenimonas fontis TaxID=2608255 RepID=A0A5B2ZE64_9GAMM|nr:type 4a pilus biogenesis protein PilO [Arenimonas fontis]KAA2285311.1 type 4a pilus biogenesis protein PilO [Arenimonas fontis]
MSKKVDLRNLDFNNSGAWPMQVKMAACVILAAVIIAFTWWFFVTEKRDVLANEEATEQKLREEFQGKQGRAANLEPLKQQLAQMEVMLQQMLRQLPSKNEMPDLIVDISQTALAAGITNELFQPGAEVQRDFYAEKPIALRMVGTYHQFGAFVSGVASLPRVVIMTMHDISLKPRGQGDATLVLEGTVKTYRYLDAEEEAAASGGAQ